MVSERTACVQARHVTQLNKCLDTDLCNVLAIIFAEASGNTQVTGCPQCLLCCPEVGHMLDVIPGVGATGKGFRLIYFIPRYIDTTISASRDKSRDAGVSQRLCLKLDRGTGKLLVLRTIWKSQSIDTRQAGLQDRIAFVPTANIVIKCPLSHNLEQLSA